MNRILEFDPESEHDVAARVLLKVHKAIDDHFPSAADPSRKFRKTVFSDSVEVTKIELSKEVAAALAADHATAEAEKKFLENTSGKDRSGRRRHGDLPQTQQSALEYSRVDTLVKGPPMTLARKVIYAGLVITILSALVAWLLDVLLLS